MAAAEKDAFEGELELRSGPIEDHLEAMATSRDLPALALEVCMVRLAEAGPPLRARLAS